MNLSEFDYPIKEQQIAQSPLPERDGSNLLVLHKKSNTIDHRRFRDISEYLRPGDVLVLNNTKVIPARLCGSKPSGGKAEITLLREVQKNSWKALVKGVHEGPVMLRHGITAHVSRTNGTIASVKFDFHSPVEGAEKADIKFFLNELGVMPLPLYIKRAAVRSDEARYQTVYAHREGAVAAPTAGLHFTEQLLTGIKDKGVQIATVTLHIGYGTFKPVTTSDISGHRMEREDYEIPEKTAGVINSAKSENRRVIAVGTTVARTLEASASVNSDRKYVTPGKGEAEIFIYPGHSFKIIDAFVTNFHLPKSTPFIMTSAFAGLTALKIAYPEALERGYRFYSYGDAMLIV
jgi:S-adenosylmethionine:tRNA ribosyltransferase-isomerase